MVDILVLINYILNKKPLDIFIEWFFYKVFVAVVGA